MKAKIGLLDVNVLLALAWPNHQHHGLAHEWFAANASHGWATCAVTELGFIRLSSNPAFTPDAVRPSDAARLLAEYCRQRKHVFWSSPAATDPKMYSFSLGHQQVNDAWLVGVATRHQGRVITLDKRLRAHDPSAARVFVLEDSRSE